MPEVRFEEELETAKSASVAQLLFKAARLWNTWAVTQIQAQPGGEHFRLAHTALLPHLDLAGTRVTELARRLGTSKQATSQLLKEMQQLGLVEIQADPADRRARRAFFSPQGRAALLHGLAHLQAMEQTLGQELGDADMATLQGLLSRLVNRLEAVAQPASAASEPIL